MFKNNTINGVVFISRERSYLTMKRDADAATDKMYTLGHTTGAMSTLRSSTELFGEYQVLRRRAVKAVAASTMSTKKLKEIKRRVGEVLESRGLLKGSYRRYDEHLVYRRWDVVSGILREIAEPAEYDASEINATYAFVDLAFKMFSETHGAGDEPHDHADGSFAFVVPIRMDQEHPEYGDEAPGVIPLARYVPEEMRGRMLKNMCPAIIDTYRRSEDGRRGYMVLAPVFMDEWIDLKNMRWLPRIWHGMGARASARSHINDAVNFATRRLGVTIVGLGAVLPRISRYGTTLEAKQTTTGHGGTECLVLGNIDACIELGVGRAIDARNMVVLGAGAIGRPMAEMIARKYLRGSEGAGCTLTVIDTDKKKVEKARKLLAKLDLGDSIKVEHYTEEEYSHRVGAVFEKSDIVISAITGKLNMSKIAEGRNLRGLVFIDDGQPGAITREQAEEYGINLAWVLGQPKMPLPELRRSSFVFGETIEAVFGCEAEAAVIAALAREMRAEGKAEDEIRQTVQEHAIRCPVTIEQVERISLLFKKYGIGVAPLQSYGKAMKRFDYTRESTTAIG